MGPGRWRPETERITTTAVFGSTHGSTKTIGMAKGLTLTAKRFWLKLYATLLSTVAPKFSLEYLEMDYDTFYTYDYYGGGDSDYADHLVDSPNGDNTEEVVKGQDFDGILEEACAMV